MTIKDIQKQHEVESALAKLEHKNKSWQSNFLKQISIMDEILMGINSLDKKESEFWIDVQTLYCNKSKTQ
jgi:hypothetical protein